MKTTRKELFDKAWELPMTKLAKQFLSESYRRDKYLQKLREFLTNPVSRQFQDFTGLAPTEETLRKIEKN